MTGDEFKPRTQAADGDPTSLPTCVRLDAINEQSARLADSSPVRFV